MERIFWLTPNGVLTAHTECLLGVKLRHSIAPVQYIYIYKWSWGLVVVQFIAQWQSTGGSSQVSCMGLILGNCWPFHFPLFSPQKHLILFTCLFLVLQCCNLIGSLDSNRVYENPLVRCILINAYRNQWGSFSFNFIACKVPPPPICQYVNKKKKWLFPQNFCGVKSGNYLSMFLFTIFSLWLYINLKRGNLATKFGITRLFSLMARPYSLHLFW